MKSPNNGHRPTPLPQNSSKSVVHWQSPNNGAQTPSIFCSPPAEHLLTGSTNYPTLPFRETCLKHGGGDILIAHEPSAGHHATGMIGNTSGLMREHHWKHTTNDCKDCITPQASDLITNKYKHNLATVFYPHSHEYICYRLYARKIYPRISSAHMSNFSNKILCAH